MSFSTKRGGFRFRNGTTFAAFHIAGINPSRNELLNRAVIGAVRMLALSHKMHAGILSGPIALFILIRCKAFSVVMTLVAYSAGSTPCTLKQDDR